jgi:hypothetical protein
MRHKFQYRETVATIVCEPEFLGLAQDGIFEAWEILESKILEDPFFRITYEPYLPEGDDHPMIQAMSYASMLSGVGPFAGVAGAVALHAVEMMRDAGAKEAIVENGGDIAFLSDRKVPVGLFADHPVLKDVAFEVESDGILGICSSSAKIGPSVSLGGSNVCTVFSKDVILADCCATALGNLVKDEATLGEALETIGSIEGIDGCLACIGDKVAMYGEIPKMIPCDRMDTGIFNRTRRCRWT